MSWDEALGETIDRLLAVREQYGPDAIGLYRGNPAVHSLHTLAYWPVFQRAVATKNVFSGSTLDTLPKFAQCGLMFGGPLLVPLPDLDRTQHLLILGANPLVSNGSLMTAPDVPGRLEAIRARGGRVIVVDPRRTETAQAADEHHFIRPGTDALFLLAMVHTIFAEDRLALGRADGLVDGVDVVERAVADFAPEVVADVCGIPADTIRRLTREFCAADRAACYGRLGTCVQEFGTLASWGVDLLNILAGKLDRPGGVMWARPAASVAFALSSGKGVTLEQWRSRVRDLPEMYGGIPAACIAEEIETPGEGQVRAMVTCAANPVSAAPHSDRIAAALESLEFYVAIDFYINESTRHADIILPPTDTLEYGTYDLGLYHLAIRDMAKWSPPAVEPPAGQLHAWEILLRIGAALMGFGEMAPEQVDAFVLSQFAAGAIGDDSAWDGLTPEEAVEKLDDAPGPDRILDLLLRVGPYGDGFGRNPAGLTLERVRAAEHGLDLGPLKPQLPDVLNTPSGRIELAPPLMLGDLDRLRERLGREASGLLLIGRRDLRSNNSWMHNLPALVKGRDRCTLHVSEPDAEQLQLETGGLARVTSRVGSLVAPVEVTDTLMPGVVSLPHGWGHDMPGVRMEVAQALPGVNANILTDDTLFDAPTATSVLNGIPVTVEPLT